MRHCHVSMSMLMFHMLTRMVWVMIAPDSISTLATSTWSARAAMHRGVRPSCTHTHLVHKGRWAAMHGGVVHIVHEGSYA